MPNDFYARIKSRAKYKYGQYKEKVHTKANEYRARQLEKDIERHKRAISNDQTQIARLRA